LRAIVEVRTDGGACGLAETYGESSVLGPLLAAKDALAGVSVFDLNEVSRRIGGVLRGQPARLLAKVYAAFEIACLDAQARHLGLPLCELLGGAVRDRVPYSAYLFFKFDAHPDSSPD